MTHEPLPPGSTIGIVGGGQLGRMLAQAAAKLGFRTAIFAPEGESPAFDVATESYCAAYDDVAALTQFAQESGAVTFEFENIPADALAIIESYSRLSPSRRALEVAQDRLRERRFLTSLDLPVAPHEAIEDASALADACDRLISDVPGARLYLKRARHGYDGKGQIKIESGGSIENARIWLGSDTALLEREVPYALELSVICVRNSLGETAFYDLPHNIHRDGVLRESVVPASLEAGVQDLARGHVGRIAAALDYVGVLAVEMFFLHGSVEPRLLINEIAPRVHNSGHWTLNACPVNQFENHVRAVAGWPIGSTERHSNARLVNLLGEEANGWRALLHDHPSRCLTLYGKHKPRPGRKMGHYIDLTPKS